MTTLIFDWSDWDGPATGHVVVTRRTWRRAPESLHVPWQVVVPVDGRATLDVAHVAGEAVSILWAPQRMASREDHVLIPDGGENLAHLLDRVDPSTLEPLPEGMPSAVDLVARAEALVSRIESGEFTGAAGRGVASITAEGAQATVTYTDGSVSTLTLPSGPAGAPGRDGVDGAPGADGRDGQDGRTPDLSWQGTALAVDGVPGPDLRGPAGKDGANGAPGPAPAIKIGAVTSGATPSATITGTSPDLTLGLVLPKGDRGDRGETGPPGVVSSASSYILVGPGRPDVPGTTAGTITGAEPVGAEYRSTDGANVGAWAWIKRPGNVWAVTDGDTGWRRITTYAPVSGGTFQLRRLGYSVTFQAWGVVTTGTGYFLSPDGSAAASQWPAGFSDGLAGHGTIQIPVLRDASLVASIERYWEGSAVRILGTVPNRGAALASWITPNAWPTTLPGTPA